LLIIRRPTTCSLTGSGFAFLGVFFCGDTDLALGDSGAFFAALPRDGDFIGVAFFRGEGDRALGDAGAFRPFRFGVSDPLFK